MQNGEVIIRTPARISQKRIEEIVQNKQIWIQNKITELNNKNFFVKKKEYKNGEAISFLGRQYVMQFIVGAKNTVEIDESNIIVRHKEGADVEKILHKWFALQAKVVFHWHFSVCFEQFCNKFQNEKCTANIPILKLRKMKARWGSCSKKGIITLNTLLVHTSLECIKYVIFHEFCHLKHHNHGKDFYAMQSQINPEWKTHKNILQQFMGEVFSL